VKGSWLQYNDVDFSAVEPTAYLIVNASAAGNTEFCIREKTAKGKVIARIPMNVITQRGQFRRDQSNQWLTLTAPLEYTPKGVANICITCEGLQDGAATSTVGEGAVSFNWLQFKNRPKYFTSVDAKAAPSQPDAQGLIRRWKLMEPIAVDVRSNVVFTDSWLRQKFSEELAKLPKQKKAKWYTLDSENYNVRLFRFAEKYGKQTYGSFYWCETVIDCPEEMQNVRLACGSNGASMWWLNDEEALLLEGDRRMVEDDGVSRRLTLKKGRNVLRCAVINGPGLADMCVRFIDENMKPVTNFNVKF
jgi:hypothetical protein